MSISSGILLIMCKNVAGLNRARKYEYLNRSSVKQRQDTYERTYCGVKDVFKSYYLCNIDEVDLVNIVFDGCILQTGCLT